jgi:hypothetical protein
VFCQSRHRFQAAIQYLALGGLERGNRIHSDVTFVQTPPPPPQPAHFFVTSPDGAVYVDPPFPSLWYVDPFALL